MLAPTNKAAMNSVVIRQMYYINVLRQGLSTAKTCEHNLLDDRSVVDRHRGCIWLLKSVCLLVIVLVT